MRINLKVQGVEMAKARLAEVGRKIDPVIRGALNTTAARTRTRHYVRPMDKFLGRGQVRNGLRIKRARGRLKNARVIPSSSGVPVTQYKRWIFEWIAPTRARIWVWGPGGRKLAAGFVNPASAAQQPWRTRSTTTRETKKKGQRTYSYQAGGLRPALGPSVAYWFKLLSNSQNIMWTNTFLQQEFEKRLRKEIAKGAR